MRSAPRSRFSLAIFLIKMIVSSATLGLRAGAFDVRFQYKRKSSRWKPQQGVWLHKQESGLSGSNQPGQQDEEDAIGPGE